MMTRRNLLRLVLFAAFVLLALGVLPEAWRGWSALLPGLSPLLSLGGALAARSAGLLALLGLPLLVLPLFKGRFFCWRLCPMGFAAETVSRLNRRNAGLIRRVPFVGKGLALLIIGSAAAGWPLLIWTDPLCIFNGFFAAWRSPLTWLSAATAGGFVLILLASLIAPNIWCHRLCPLGGLQEWLAQLGNRLRAARGPAAQEAPTALSRAHAGRRVFLGFALEARNPFLRSFAGWRRRLACCRSCRGRRRRRRRDGRRRRSRRCGGRRRRRRLARLEPELHHHRAPDRDPIQPRFQLPGAGVVQAQDAALAQPGLERMEGGGVVPYRLNQKDLGYGSPSCTLLTSTKPRRICLASSSRRPKASRS